MLNQSTVQNSSEASPGAPVDKAPCPAFSSIAILHHPKKPESLILAKEIEHFLRQQGCTTIWHESAWDEEAVLSHIDSLDLLITLGGDGTLLRAARMGAPHQTPMLGVKMGRLGFLAELNPDAWREPMARLAANAFWIEERLMLHATVERTNSNGERSIVCQHEALNEVVFSRGDLARVVRISAELDGGYLTQYTCDGLIVSTATGSTGYALAVGGPILPPELRNILVIPIAPHLSMDRAVVLSEGAMVRLRAFSDHRPILTVDGQVVVEIEEGDEVVIVSSQHMARFVRMRERSYFYQTLMEKMQWTI